MAENGNPLPPEPVVTPRQAEACRYRVQGYSYREIGRIMGIRPDKAHAYVAQALKLESGWRNSQRDELRETMMDRLDGLLVVCTGMVEDEKRPDKIRLAAVTRVLRIEERRAKLMGLDIALETPDDMIPVDPAELVKAIRERVATIKRQQALPSPN